MQLRFTRFYYETLANLYQVRLNSNFLSHAVKIMHYCSKYLLLTHQATADLVTHVRPCQAIRKTKSAFNAKDEVWWVTKFARLVIFYVTFMKEKLDALKAF